MIVLTGPDGRTTRLSPDGKKIKDDNTGIERKTKWDGGKLVSEISGAGSGKITQSFSVDPEHHQLRIVAVIEGGRNNQPRTITHVYDSEPRSERLVVLVFVAAADDETHVRVAAVDGRRALSARLRCSAA